jgi:hypothetical protein
MPVATTTEAGRQVITEAAKAIMDNATSGRATVAHADRARKLAEARRAADTLTPLESVGKAPLEAIPDVPLFEDAPEKAAAAEPTKAARLVLQTTVTYRGRQITITAQDMKLDAFCDLLDKRLGEQAKRKGELT